jgi:hypothetical protein
MVVKADFVESLSITNARELRTGVAVAPKIFEFRSALPPCHFECVEHHPQSYLRLIIHRRWTD